MSVTSQLSVLHRLFWLYLSLKQFTLNLFPPKPKLQSSSIVHRLVNIMKPGSVKKINNSTMAFKCMENINVFLEAAREMGVPAQETFQTVDLWERQNLNSVVICLQSLGRKVGKYETISTICLIFPGKCRCLEMCDKLFLFCNTVHTLPKTQKFIWEKSKEEETPNWILTFN